jgi:beta-lactam-binding protein with PASTA domain
MTRRSGNVINQSPAATAFVNYGSTVQIELSAPSSTTTTQPDKGETNSDG